MKKNYLIPCQKRSTKISAISCYTTLRIVDGVGLYVEHEKGVHPTPEQIRRNLISVQEIRMLIQANSIQEALEEFYKEEAVRTGGKHKALTISDSKSNPVIEYTGCKHMGNKNGGINCTYYDDEYTEKDSFMFCVIDGLDDPPNMCPIHRQKEDDRIEIKKVGGVWVKFHHKTTQECKGINLTKFK